jgi:diguanylate cyclase (GGDEF)-like protein/PAS domain S-box-containing protein
LQLNLFIELLILASIISLALTIYIWTSRKDAIRAELFFLMLSITIWCIASLFEAVFTDLGIKIIFTKISYAGVVTSPVLFLFFVSRYTNTDNWITVRTRIFLFVIPSATFLMAATNESHMLVWPDIYLRQNRFAGIFAFYEHGLWYWVNIVYSYIFLAAGIVILISSLIRYKKFYSLQARVLIIASIAPFLGNIIYSFQQSGLEGMDITPICFSFSGLFLTLAIFRYRLFDIKPVAREAVTENLYDGVLVLNRDNMIVDLNRAACRLLSIGNEDIGKPADTVLAGYSGILGLIHRRNKGRRSLKQLQIGEKGLFLELRATRLLDNRNNDIGMVMILRDITDARVAEKKLEESQNLLLNIIDFLPDATFAIDTGGRVIVWNRAMEDLTGMAKDKIMGKDNHEYSLPFYGERRPMIADHVIGDPEGIESQYNVVEKKGNKLVAELELEKDGRTEHLWLAASPLLDSNDRVIGAIESIRNITDLKNIEKQLRNISFHDSLTGLYNRAYFEEELERLNRSRMLPLSIIMADLNGLKLVNDAFGHDMGDRLLKKAASIIKKSCRSEDIVARWGGDEFSIVLHSTDEKETEEIIARIQSACGRARFSIPVSISLGYATKKKSRTMIKTIIKKAEDSMYRSKLISSQRVQNEIVASLTRSLFEKNIETEDSSQRVVRIAKRMGESLDLPENRMEELILHAKLHDIGKVAVREKLLKKKGPLDKEEWEEVKKHTEIGYRIANTSTLLSPIAEYILCQHEWWDGSGYPRNLKGDEIPLISRIVAVVDSYEAMIGNRPYRKALSREKAVDELLKFSGTQFDPELVKVFITVLEELKI